MTVEEKAEKFDEIQRGLWDLAKKDNMLVSMVSANLIRSFGIVSPSGEDPESA